MSYRHYIESLNLEFITWRDFAHLENVRGGIGNHEPPHHLWGNIAAILHLLNDMRAHFDSPITLFSTYRNAKYNERVGGATNSFHLRNEAVDFALRYIPLRKQILFISGRRPQHMWGLGVYENFIHLDFRPRGANW